MAKKEEVKLERKAVARAIRKHLDAYYKESGTTNGDDALTEQPSKLDEDEELFKAIYKSKYVSRHLDWLYVVEIVFAVLDHYPRLSPDGFAEKLELAIAETIGQRDYLAIVPIAFKPSFGFFHSREPAFTRPVPIGEYTFYSPASTVKGINKIFVKHDFPTITESDFGHASRTSNEAFSREILMTFRAHGAEDWLRHSVESKFRAFCRLIEVFANTFENIKSGFGKTRAVHHFFLLSKTTGDLRRLPTTKPISLDFELSAALLKTIKMPEFSNFFSDISSSPESMYGRLRNAIKFFSMAFNSDDKVTSFLFYVISTESIFSRDKNAPIKATLADLASILCFPPSQRNAAYEMIRKSYDLRSAIVHSGKTSVQEADVVVARQIAARAIYCSLFLCDHIKTDEGKLEDNFFNHLRDQKLGIVKAVVPRAVWSLPEIKIIDKDD